MAENDIPKKTHYPRRNLPQRLPPGVQKALHNFGVPDLRHILDKKHREQGETPKDKIPPPDPSYNYLKDPARDGPARTPSQPNKTDNRKPISRNKPENNTKDIQNSAEKDNENQPSKTGKPNFRGRNPSRGREGGKPTNKEQDIIDPFNIKIQLSTETGQRSCVLDEETKIADIKHVPDHKYPLRGRGRGSFRGRGRGRGSFRGRGGFFNYKNTESYSKEIKVNTNEDKANEDNENNEFTTEYQDDSVEQAQQQNMNNFDSKLSETITITSSNYQDGDVKRCVEVKSENDEKVEEKK